MAEAPGAAGNWEDWGNWVTTWAQAQQRLWQSWAALAQPAAAARAAAGGDAITPWQVGPAQWLQWMQSAFASAAPGLSAAPGMGGWFLEQWSAPMRLMSALTPPRHQTTETTGTTPQPADWIAAFTTAFAPLAAGLGTAGAPQDQLARGLTAFWGLPMDMWRRLTASLSALPGDATFGGKAVWGGSQPAAAGEAAIERFLAAPPLGYGREWQEQGQQVARDWLAYQRAQSAYFGILTRIAIRTAEVVTERFARRVADGKPLQSMREAYDLFVDCAEDAYAEVVTAADFGKLSAELMNAAVAVKRHAQAMIEEAAAAANLPTRRELDTAHRRAQTLRRQLAVVQDELQDLRAAPPAVGSADLEALRGELAVLRAEVAELRDEGRRDAEKSGKVARAASPRKAATLENTEG